MTDRELLELAAKAAGYTFLKYHNEHGLSGPWAEINKPAPESCTSRWNPIVNDGDALRLAVKLSLSVFTGGFGSAAVTGWIVNGENAEVINIQERYDDNDALSATRRAIVRAAAEIGKAMP